MNAPTTQAEIEALADALSASANDIHARLLRAMRKPHPAAPADALPGLTEQAARSLFDAEVALRQQANSLYLQAAVLAASGLGGAQATLLQLATRARDQIRRIDRIKALADLGGALLAVGAAVATGQPERLRIPLENLKQQLDALPSA